MKFETVRILFLSDVLVCCHPETLLPWPRDVTTSPLNRMSVLSGLILEKIYASFWSRQTKLSVISGCRYYVGVRRAGFHFPDTYTNFVVLCSYMNIMQYS